MGYEEVKAIANLFLALRALRVLTVEDKFCAGGGIGVGGGGLVEGTGGGGGGGRGAGRGGIRGRGKASSTDCQQWISCLLGLDTSKLLIFSVVRGSTRKS